MGIRRVRLCIAVCVSALWFGGCGEDPAQLFETAQFEEQQGNLAHARDLYEQILQINPEGPLAAQARARLADIQQ